MPVDCGVSRHFKPTMSTLGNQELQQYRPHLLRYALLMLLDGCANFRRQLGFIRAGVKRYPDHDDSH
jgi:hypothetical protein